MAPQGANDGLTKPTWLGLALTCLTLVPFPAFAHTGVGATAGFALGFLHPLTGLDHVLAMTMVGVLAWQLGGRALWLLPAAFVLVMALGGALGVAGVGVPFVETGIALSVIVLGAIVAFGVKPPLAAMLGAVGLFAVCHGHAHGSEMPETAVGVGYGLGFMLATAILHAAGIGLGFVIGRIGESRGPVIVRASGALAAFAGVAILAGLV